MKLLHTSDWHLGQHFIHKERKLEHGAFLDWLLETLDEQRIDLLIVSGDIFDTGTPPNYALELYYTFLSQVRLTCCRNVVITGGNHDSVSMLKAPKTLLKYMNIHIVESVSKDMEDDIIEIFDPQGEVIALVCAVPFLRDRDIRKSVPGESYAEKSLALLEGVNNYYRNISELAVQRRASLGSTLPLIATGHLFTAGGEISDGVREIYVGSLGKISASSFPKEFDYLALGHLHKPQVVGKSSHIRYSGSPIPLSFSEAGGEKLVVTAEFTESGAAPVINTLTVPEFQKLRVLRGSVSEVEAGLEKLDFPEEDKKIWLEVQITESSWIKGADAHIKELCADLPVELFAIKLIHEQPKPILSREEEMRALDHLEPAEVFEKRLASEDALDEEAKQELRHAFNEIFNLVHEAGEDRDL